MPTTAPTASVDPGIPLAFSCRPGSAYLRTCAIASEESSEREHDPSGRGLLRDRPDQDGAENEERARQDRYDDPDESDEDRHTDQHCRESVHALNLDAGSGPDMTRRPPDIRWPPRGVWWSVSARRRSLFPGRAEALAVVMDGRGDLLELVGVLAGVVGAEEQLTATDELDAYIGLRAASVTAIERRELRGGCNCSFHVWPLLFGLILPGADHRLR